MCGGGSKPTQATVDPAAERQKAADEAAQKANAALITDRRRKRGQKGLLANETGDSSVLAGIVSPGKPQSVLDGIMS